MGQYTYNKMLISAYTMIGELAANEVPNADMQATGLEIINSVINELSVGSIYIPFQSSYTFSMVPGQSTYTISDILLDPTLHDNQIVDLIFANYAVPTPGDDTLIYPIKVLQQSDYYLAARQTTVLSRPSTVLLYKHDQSSELIFYPAPDQAYVVTLQVKSVISNIANGTGAMVEFLPFYYSYFKYEVARQLLGYYPSANWSQTQEAKYQDLYAKVKAAAQVDLSLRPSAIMSTRTQPYWANILVY